MADKRSYKSSHNVSRHTMVMRKARDDDARRLDDEEESRRMTAALVARATSIRRKASTRIDAAGSRRRSGVDRAVSGRTIVVRRESDASGRLPISTRLSGPQTSVRVTGGDTIIRYQSGDMVIKRGTRRAQLRRQIIWGYALGYLAVFGLYVYFLLTGTVSMTPEAFVQKAFARRHSSSITDLERAAMEAMRGNRTPAEVRLAQSITFYDDNRDTIKIEAGDRLTLLNAAKLGKVILDDLKKDESKRTFAKPFLLYKETYLANLDWPHWLTVYNAIGFFLLMLLFLWRPLQHYLGTQGKKTAVAIRNARDAQDEAEDYRNKYRELAADLEQRGDKLRAGVAAAVDTDRAAALEHAQRQAEGIAGGIESALATETRKRAGALSEDTAREACRQAKAILEKRLGQAEHDIAIDEMIADIAGMQLS